MSFTGTLGSAFAPVPLMSCQVVPPSVVRKTWPSVSPKPENAEYVAYATFGSCASTATAVTVRPDGRAGVVRSVQFEPVPASALVVFEIRLPEALPAVVPTQTTLESLRATAIEVMVREVPVVKSGEIAVQFSPA